MLMVFGLGLAVAGPATAASAVPPFDGLEYVALGDSYSAGFGLLPLSPSDPAPGCYQAAQNYPHQVAAALGLTLNDRTCSGAVTANIRDTPQITMTGGGPAPVQSNSLSASTDIVTVTIGGNDLKFAEVAAFCVRLAIDASSFPLGDPLVDNCKDYYWPIQSDPDNNSLLNNLNDIVTPAVVETFALISEKAPNAKVFVIGYPSIAPDIENIPTPQPPGCFTSPIINEPFSYRENSFPYSQVDTLYLHQIEDEMDNVLEKAALDAGFTFIPTWTATQAHSACAAVDPYIFGITLTNSNQNSTPTPDPALFVELGALHPNPTGVDFIRDQVLAAMKNHPAFGGAAPGGPELAATGVDGAPLAVAGLGIAFVGLVLLVARRTGAQLLGRR